ncbi:coiled-coil domain-containing protein 138-like isoform X2 [Scyliorhinus canicula]|uniref:coiled-coil domain-containing protein 138-like isoform X2 n=1 Tax=Scyliorhinus canicula TaxID=7830 RepID=UPI0018F6F083|nr:coiled-coil domain-containing protein 138-like isoform X2 [Scyliorhinus canicula]
MVVREMQLGGGTGMGNNEDQALDAIIERLKGRYLGNRQTESRSAVYTGNGMVERSKPCLSDSEDQDSTVNLTRINSKSNPCIKGALDTSSGKKPSPMKSPISGLTCNERKHYKRMLRNLCKAKFNTAWADDPYDYSHCSSQALEGFFSEEELTIHLHRRQDSGTQLYTETDDNITGSRKNGCLSESLEDACLLPADIMQIYNELTCIRQHLQRESVALQEYRHQVQSHEHCLANREALLFKHQDALTKLRGVEEEVHAKFQIMKEQHAAEVSQLQNAFKEKIKENKRLKSSFETLKELNDSLKKQISDVKQQNKKLEIQAKKTQNRLENLQRKNELCVVQKFQDNVPTGVKEISLEKREKIQPARRISRPLLNSNLCELFGVLLDWISDGYLYYLTSEDENDVQTSLGPNYLPRKSIQEKCVKILPLITAQIHLMPPGNIKLQLTLVKFIYWALMQIDREGMQKTMITSTMRRLGEELFRGTVTQENPSESVAETKPKASAFFRSSNLNVRFLSALSILKTITQVDYLAQAFDILLNDLKTDEGKALFLEYRAMQIILCYLKPSSKSLLCSAVDVILQMTMESRYLQHFLQACSSETWFRTCSVLLRNSKLEMQILEKLSVILQKLSKIKSNKKLFELFTIHILIQELHRTTDPEHTFLAINLQSILFNLGITKFTALASSPGNSHSNQ